MMLGLRKREALRAERRPKENELKTTTKQAKKDSKRKEKKQKQKQARDLEGGSSPSQNADRKSGGG